jgi:hypothetical protein
LNPFYFLFSFVFSENQNEIPEITGNKSKRPTEQVINSNFQPNNDSNNNVTFSNPPILKWFYTDHKEKCIKVVVAIPLFTGIRNINFEIAENGEEVSFKYTWPSAMFRADELFSQQIKKNILDNTHPKVHSLKSALLEQAITENTFPTGLIKVKLPIKVQKEVGTWTKEAIKANDGTRVVVVEFKGFQQQQIIKEADTTISFEDSD